MYKDKLIRILRIRHVCPIVVLYQKALKQFVYQIFIVDYLQRFLQQEKRERGEMTNFGS